MIADTVEMALIVGSIKRLMDDFGSGIISYIERALPIIAEVVVRYEVETSMRGPYARRHVVCTEGMD